MLMADSEHEHEQNSVWMLVAQMHNSFLLEHHSFGIAGGTWVPACFGASLGSLAMDILMAFAQSVIRFSSESWPEWLRNCL